MINKILQVASLLLAGFFISGCSDDDCPTSGDEQPVVFVCGATFYAPYTSGGAETRIGIGAGVVGDPVPDVTSFRWLGRSVGPCDEGLPCFNDEFYSPFTKDVDVLMVIEGDSIAFALSIPDSFHMIEPPVETQFLSAGEPLDLIWSKSPDAERYDLKIYVLYDPTPGEFTIELDTTFYVTDTSWTLPAEYMQWGRQFTFFLSAVRGIRADPGQAANFILGRYHGFTISSYKALGIQARIYQTCSTHSTKPLSLGIGPTSLLIRQICCELSTPRTEQARRRRCRRSSTPRPKS